MSERQILREYVTYLADLMGITSTMTIKQVKIAKEGERIVARFRDASSKPDFWSKALKRLDSSQIGALFFSISRIQEVFVGLTNYGNLPKQQQNEVLNMLKQVTEALKKLKSTLK